MDNQYQPGPDPIQPIYRDDVDREEPLPRELRPALDPEPEDKPETFWQKVWEWVKVLVAAVVIGLLVTTFVMQRNTVSGASMRPTLKESDELLVEKVSKWFGGISRGDIITVHMENPAFREGQANIIKRVIGLPGDTVKIADGGVYINGARLDEPYLPAGTVTSPLNAEFSELTLAENEYFVMGDNRGVSLDSRRFGPITKDDVIGEVLVRFLPLNAIGVPK